MKPCSWGEGGKGSRRKRSSSLVGANPGHKDVAGVVLFHDGPSGRSGFSPTKKVVLWMMMLG